MPVQDPITEKIHKKFRLAIGRFQGDDRVDWDVSLCFLPGAPPFYAMILCISNPIMGQTPITVGGVMQDPHMKQEAVDQVVQAAMENLRNARTEALNAPLPEQGENGLLSQLLQK